MERIMLSLKIRNNFRQNYLMIKYISNQLLKRMEKTIFCQD